MYKYKINYSYIKLIKIFPNLNKKWQKKTKRSINKKPWEKQGKKLKDGIQPLNSKRYNEEEL